VAFSQSPGSMPAKSP